MLLITETELKLVLIIENVCINIDIIIEKRSVYYYYTLTQHVSFKQVICHAFVLSVLLPSCLFKQHI